MMKLKPKRDMPDCRLKEQKRRELVGKLKKEKKQLAQALRLTLKAEKFALRRTREKEEELKLQLQTLQDELDEEKAYALDQLNDRAEAVAELMKRAAPEGWALQSISNGDSRQVSRIAGYWNWTVYEPYLIHKSGACATLAEAVKAAEAVKIPKAKKAKRK